MNTITTNKDKLRKIVEIFNTGDLSEVESLFSPNYIDHQADLERLSGITVDGPEEFKQVVLGARKHLANLKVTIEDLVSEENTIVARLQWLGNDENGKSLKRETLDMLRIENDLILEHWGAEEWKTETP